METLRASDQGREDTQESSKTDKELSYVDKCPECGSPAVYLDSYRAELICSKCNVVIADALILPGTESPRDSEQYPVETDDSKLLPQLYFGSRDATGRPVGQGLVWLLRRTAQTYNLKSGERSAVLMETRIRRLVSQLGLPATISIRAIYLFRKAKRMNIVRKPGLNDWALALILAACRETRYVITIEDLVAGIVGKDYRSLRKRSESNVQRYYNVVKRKLGLPLQTPSIENYVTYFSGKLGLNFLAQLAIEISHRNPKLNSTPHCVAAGALYIAARDSGFRVSQKEFCKQANLSEISLRSKVAMLGGMSLYAKEAPEVIVDELGGVALEPLEEGQDVKSESEHDPESYGPSPPTPEQAKRDNDGTKDGQDDADKRDAGKEPSDLRKGFTNPPGRLRLEKNRPHERNKATKRDDAKVKRRLTSSSVAKRRS